MASYATGDDEDSTCVAILLDDNGTKVNVFDAKGRPRRFELPSSNGKTKKVCFSTHGVAGLLTPCFDENGEHGEPDEGCFCGEDEPHIHAHFYDPNICNNRDEDKKDLISLAQLTLFPVDDHDDDEKRSQASTASTKSIDHCVAQLKNENKNASSCCSDKCGRKSNNGLNGEDCEIGCCSKSIPKNDCCISNMDDDSEMKHLNPIDSNSEHPYDSCGIHDYHGKLSFILKRQLTEYSCKDPRKNKSLHFFKLSKKPAKILDTVLTVFDIDSSNRANTVREMKCCNQAGQCDCPSYPIPIIQDPCCNNGIDPCCENGFEFCKIHNSCHAQTQQPVKINAASTNTKFETSCCSSKACIEKEPEDVSTAVTDLYRSNVNWNKSPSSVDSSNHQQKSESELIGRSHFHVKHICCSSEGRQIQKLLGPVEGIIDMSFNVTSKMAYIDHDIHIISADEIAKKLDENKFGCVVKRDARKIMMMQSFESHKVFVSSELKLLKNSSSYDFNKCQSALDEFSKEKLNIISLDQSSDVLTIEHNPYFVSLSMIRHDLLQNAIESEILFDGSADGKWTSSLFPDNNNEQDTTESHTSKMNPFVILSGLFWIISMLSYIGDNWKNLKYAGIISVVLGLPPIAIKAIYTLKRCQFDTNCMMLFAVCGAVGLQDFPEAAAVTFLFSISEWLEMRATSRARNALSAIVNLRPDKANLVNPITNEILVIPAASVGIGATVAVKAGDKIPCDGIVIEGTSTVDESSLTGEARPVKKTLRDKVSGGTINCGSTQLVIKATATVDNSAVGRLIKMVEEAQANKSPTEKVVDDFARLYTPIVVFASICMCTIPWAFGTDSGRTWTYMGLILIVIACPCALIISTPVTYVAGLAATAQKGIVIKGGAHLEALGKVKTIAFDKTGTLTEGRFQLIDLRVVADRIPRKKLLEYLAVVESRATHPLASAILAAAKNEGVTSAVHLSLENHTFLAGEGVHAKVNGEDVYVGNMSLFRRIGLHDSLPDDVKELALKWSNDGGTVGFISIEGSGVVGAYCVADSLRKESRQVVESLNRMGINCHMLTGDGCIAASSIGRQVGLHPNNVNSQLKPEDKLRFVKEMKDLSDVNNSRQYFYKKKKLVLMCGDGINDAPALASAHVGVAMGEGAALAMETSDVTLMDSNLNKLLYSIQMGSRVTHTIIQNIAFSIAVKAVVMAFTFAGKSSLWAAIVSDVGAMLLVTLNGMKLLPSKKSVNEMEVSLKDSGVGNEEAV